MSGQVAGFTSRELDVARLLGQGLPNKEIGAALSIETASVAAVVSRILKKLDVENRTQAALAFRNWLVS